MRVFWALIGVLVLATGSVLLSKRAGGQGDFVERVGDRDASPAREAGESTETPEEPTAVDERARESASLRTESEEERPVLSIDPNAPPRAFSGGRDEAESTERDDSMVVTGEPAEGGMPDLDALLGLERDLVQGAEAARDASEAPAAEELAGGNAAAASESEGSGEVVEGTTDVAEVEEPSLAAPVVPVVEREDGALLIGDEYVVRGVGTRDEPFEIGLDLLVSVQDSYNPRLGQDKLPAWLDRFKGKYVRIVGNMLFPLWAEETDELLLMKNQWDGCCIGVPPTPYDAVEVKLASAVDLSRVGSDYGGVVGRFDVEPYIRSDWLLGLYVMDEARLDGSE